MRLKRLGQNTKGAVLAEFAFAFMPVATMFLFVTQFGRFEMCRLASYHAANVAVRACAVTNVGGDDINPGGDDVNGPATDADKAAQVVLKPYLGKELSVGTITCDHNGGADGDDKVTLAMKYTCQVPVGGTLMCGGVGSSKTWNVVASYPHQGAHYTLEKP